MRDIREFIQKKWENHYKRDRPEPGACRGGREQNCRKGV